MEVLLAIREKVGSARVVVFVEVSKAVVDVYLTQLTTAYTHRRGRGNDNKY